MVCKFCGKKILKWSAHAKTCDKFKEFKEKKLSKDILYKLYIEEERSAHEIGIEFELSACCIIKRLRQLNIQTRGIKESKTQREKEKRKQTCLKKYGVEHVWLDKSISDKKKKTWIKNYGVDNPRKAEKVKTRIVNRSLETKYKLGMALRPELKTEWELYKSTCVNRANKTYRKIKHKINPEKLKRGRNLFTLDHIFSIKDGFINNVPPSLVSHPSNLRMLREKDNMSKNYRSAVSIYEFYRKIIEYENHNNKKN